MLQMYVDIYEKAKGLEHGMCSIVNGRSKSLSSFLL